MNKIQKSGMTLVSAVVAFAVAFPVQALITNADVAGNAGIIYSKLKLGGKITSSSIKDGTIQSKDIKNNAIKEDKIDDGAVTSAKILDGTIVAADLAAGTVSEASLSDGSVTSAKIAADTIVAADIATGGVATAEILNGTILNADLAGGSYTGITTVGTLTGLTMGGALAMGTNSITGTGTVSATTFNGALVGNASTVTDGVYTTGAGTVFLAPTGNGSGLTALTATNISTGTLADARLTANVSLLGSDIASAEIVNGTIVNEDVNASAAIAGSKISPDFVAQDVVTTGYVKSDAGFDTKTATGVLYIGSTANNISMGVTAYDNFGIGVDNAMWDADAITTSGIGSGFAINTTNGGSADGNITLNAGTGSITLTAGSIGGLPVAAGAVALAPVTSVDTSINAGANNAIALTLQGSSNGATPNIFVAKNSAGTNEIVVSSTGATTFTQGITATGGVLGNLTGDVTGTVSGNAGTVTNGVYTTGTGNVTSTMILDDTVTGGAAGAGVDIKANTITADNIAVGGVATSEILNGTILNEDIDAAAGIVDTKLATIATAGKVSNSATTATDLNTASAIVARSAGGNFTAGTITANLTGNASTVTTNANLTGDVISTGNATTIDANKVLTGMIAEGTILTGDIATDTILAGNIAAGAVGTSEILNATILTEDISTGGVTSTNILNGTIAGDDLATNIAISTTGNFIINTDKFSVTGANGNTVVAGTLGVTGVTTATGLVNANGGIAVDTGNFTVSGTTGDVLTAGDLAVNGDNITSDGALDVKGATGMNVNTTSGDMTLDAVVGGAGSILPGADSQDFIGADATRWSAIYADTLNYSSAITDDNSANTTVSLGDANTLDTVNITAKTAISSEHWSVTEPGVATFVSVDGPVGSVTPGTGAFTTISATGAVTLANAETISNATDGTFTFTRNTDAAVTITAADTTVNADMTIVAGGTGDMTLGDADSDTTVAGAFVTASTFNANGVTVIGDGGDNVSVNSDTWDISTAGAVTGITGITSAMITDSTIVSADIFNGTIAGDDLAANIAISTSGTLTSTGTVDFSGATTKIDVVASLTDGGTCSAAGNVGTIVVGDTAAAANAVLLICEQTGSGPDTFGWAVR